MTDQRTGARGNAGSFRVGGDSFDAGAAPERPRRTGRLDVVLSCDHYAVLGVRPDASSEAVRAAYIALMKRHHPDRMAQPGDATGRAAALNEAMYHLGDGDRRRAYDGTRRPAATAALHLPPPSPPSPRRGVIATAAICVIALLAVVVVAASRFAAPVTPATNTVASASVAHAGGIVDAEGARMIQLVSQQATLDLDWIAIDAGAGGVERFSRRCYAGATAAASRALVLFCGAVDARGARLFDRPLPYFAAATREARFAAAASPLALDAAVLWHGLEAQARVFRAGEFNAAPSPDAPPPMGATGRTDSDAVDITPDN